MGCFKQADEMFYDICVEFIIEQLVNKTGKIEVFVPGNGSERGFSYCRVLFFTGV